MRAMQAAQPSAGGQAIRHRAWHRTPSAPLHPRPPGHLRRQLCLQLAATQTRQPETGQTRITGSCYEDVISQLAQRAIKAAETLPADRKHIVAIAGAPGSGKSTLAAAVQAAVNQQHPGWAVLLPMDGFHLYRRELDQLPNPQEARARRGAHWTFNADALVAAVRRVRDLGETKVPSFDHGVGDPVEDDIEIQKQHRIVLVEGLYLLMDMDPWSQLSRLVDDTWFVEVDLDTAMERVYRRQTSHGVTPEVSQRRIATNDRPNGELVNSLSQQKAAVVVPSSIPFANPASSH